jgi:hypothetical protein
MNFFAKIDFYSFALALKVLITTLTKMNSLQKNLQALKQFKTEQATDTSAPKIVAPLYLKAPSTEVVDHSSAMHDIMNNLSLWYPHKYQSFEDQCATKEEFFDCLDMYITKGISTVDFELQKYIIYEKLFAVEYLCTKYVDLIQDWKHLICTCIISHIDVLFMVRLLDAYEKKHNDKIWISPSEDEILWLCLNTKYYTPLYALLHRVNMEDEWLEQIVSCKENPNLIEEKLKCWDMANPANPRNLVYAIKDGNAELAKHLIEQGCVVDVWNNYPMRMCLVRPEMKQDSQLMKMMLQNGAKIPLYFVKIKKEISRMFDQHLKKPEQPLKLDMKQFA